MILFCLPYAGGAANIYSQWNKYFDSSVEVKALELKGRGTRFKEEFYEDIQSAVDDLYQMIEKDIEEKNYCLFGHSMGGLLAYELYYRIYEKQNRLPEHIFFSGAKAPGAPDQGERIHLLPDHEFIKAVDNYGGTPKEVLENQNLLDIVLPILRNDFRLIENYHFRKRTDRLKCDITSIRGTKDSVKENDVREFIHYTEGRCRFYEVQGNHFFIKTNKEKVIDIVNTALANMNEK